MNASLRKDANAPAPTVEGDKDGCVSPPARIDVSLMDAARLHDGDPSAYAEFLGSIPGEESDEEFAKAVDALS